MLAVKEISIFKHDDKKILTRTEREILFEQLKLNSDIESYHFELFNELEDRLLNESRFKSDIPAIVIKNNIDFLVPLVKKKTGTEFHISVQLNTPKEVRDIDLINSRVAASNSQLDAIGIIFNNTNVYRGSYLLPTLLATSSLRDKLISGTYGLYSWYYPSYYGTQVTYSRFFQDTTHLKVGDKQFIIYFKNKQDVMKSLLLLDSYVNYMINFYNASLHFMYSALSYSPFTLLTEFKKPTIKPYLLEKHTFKSPILDAINSVYTNNLTSTPSRIVLLYDIIDGKLWGIYQNAKMSGLDDATFKKEISCEKKRQETNRNIFYSTLDDIRRKSIYYKQISIARSLFHKSNIRDLTPKELEVIDLTYKKDLIFAKYVQNNKCAHLKLLERVMQNSSSGKFFYAKEWTELKGLISEPSQGGTELLKCTSCELLVLCPHHYERFDYNTTTHNQGDQSLRTILLNKYAGKAPIEDAYFCKICGEKIITKYRDEHAVFIQGQKVTITHTEDVMYNKIWKETRVIIGTSIVFSTVTDINSLTTIIAETIQPFIEDEQTKLDNIKTSNQDVIYNTVYLYINLYVYAFLIKMMTQYPDTISFKVRYNKKQRPIAGGDASYASTVNMHALQKYINAGLNTLVSNKLSLIQKIPSISLDSIKPLFIKTFKNIYNTNIKTPISDAELPPEYIVNSVVYSYLYYAYKKHDQNIKYSDVKKILGVEIQDVVKLDNIIESAVIPSIWKLHHTDDDICIFNDPKFLELQHKYVYDSFVHFMSYIKNDLYKTPVFGSVKHMNHADEYNNIKKLEDIIQKTLISRYLIRISSSKYIQFGEYNYDIIDLSKIFCRDGKKHVFDIHVYEEGITRLEVSKKNIHSWMFDAEKNKEFVAMKRIDMKCSKCNALLSTTKDEGITNTINQNEQIIGFFNLYAYKCPSNVMHIFKDDICIHCGVTKIMIFNNDLAYYNKYKEIFYKYVDMQRNINMKPVKCIKKDKLINKDWKIDNIQTLELAKISKVPVNILTNIGLIEGYDYSKVEKGEIDPNANADDYINVNRIILLETYMNMLLIEYEMLKNGRVDQPSLETFLKAWDTVDFSTFPAIAVGYHDMYRSYIYSGLDKNKMVNFVLYSLSKALVDIYKHFSKKNDVYSDAAIAFVKYIMGKITTSELLSSDPGILRGKNIDIDDDDEDGDAIAADYDDRDLVIDEKFDPFSLESSGIDTETLSDNMGTGDD